MLLITCQFQQNFLFDVKMCATCVLSKHRRHRTAQLVIIPSSEGKVLREEIGERLASLGNFYAEKAVQYGQCVQPVRLSHPSPTHTHVLSAPFQLRDIHLGALRVLLDAIEAQHGTLSNADVAAVKREADLVIHSSQVGGWGWCGKGNGD
jgi:hypothetical protein